MTVDQLIECLQHIRNEGYGNATVRMPIGYRDDAHGVLPAEVAETELWTQQRLPYDHTVMLWPEGMADEHEPPH